VFKEFIEQNKVDLMKEYVDYFIGIDRAREKCKILSGRESGSFFNKKNGSEELFSQKLSECYEKSKHGSFMLPDLLCLPFKRILDYHVLLASLLKLTESGHEAIGLIESSRLSFSEVGDYLDACKGDGENLRAIEKLSQRFVAAYQQYARGGLDLFQYGHYFDIKSITLKIIYKESCIN
jgi:hypothetical protein